MNSHKNPPRGAWRFQLLVLNLHCATLVVCALLFPILLEGRSAFPVAVGYSSGEKTQRVKAMHSSNLLGCERDVFCSLLKDMNSTMSTKDEEEVTGAKSCHCYFPLKASGAGEQVAIYAAENAGPEQLEGSHQHLRAAQSSQPYKTSRSFSISSSPWIQPSEPLVRACCSPRTAQVVQQSNGDSHTGSVSHSYGVQEGNNVMATGALSGKVEGLAVRRRLDENIRTASLVASVHQSPEDTDNFNDSDALPAVWVFPQDAKVETSPVDSIESAAFLSSTQTGSDETGDETKTEDDIVSSQAFGGCKRGSCARIRMTVQTPTGIPVAPLYATNVVAPQVIPVASVPFLTHPTTPYAIWPMTYSPYHGLFSSQNSWYSASQASMMQSGMYGGGTSGWTGMGYQPLMY